MATNGNVINVEFRRRGGPIERVERLLEETDEIRSQIEANRVRHEWQRRRQGERIRELERLLRLERHAAQPVTEEAVLAALLAVFDGTPVETGRVARALFEAPSHSTLVRVGQALRRLADAGKVHRTPSDFAARVTCRWEPSDA